MKAKDFVKNATFIDADEPISRAISLFEKDDAIVVTKDGKYEGMLIEKELARAKLPPKAKVKNFIRHAPKVDINEPIEEIARLMLESDIFHLPVIKDNKIIGVVNCDDLLIKIIEKEFGELSVKNFISKDVAKISPDDNIGRVIKIFRENNISRIPVVKDDKVVGIITIKDLIEKVIHPEDKPEYGEFIAEKKRYLKIPVKGIMTSQPFMMPPEAKIKDVIKEMMSRNIGGMLIGKDDKLIGIVTKKDLLEPIASYGKEEKVFIQFCGEIDKIEEFDSKEGKQQLKNFIRKYENFLENGYLYAYLKKHKEIKHGLPLIYCKLRLSSPKGIFVAANEGYGFRQALKNAIDAMEKQIEKIKG
ncbi:MAG: CBS domain-containing protein [Thermoplasmata archaeon]|nr:CBS domain-containing protein [Thermoplasmata archaeon]